MWVGKGSLMSRPYSHDWKLRALEARNALRGVPEGRRELALRELAGKRNLNTLRKALAAYEFLQRWTAQKAEAAVELEEAPQSVVEVLARWSAFDEEGAVSATSRWYSERIPVQRLTREMREARAIKGQQPGKTIAVEYRKTAVGLVKDLVAWTVGGRISRTEVKYKSGDDPVADFRFLTVEPDGEARGRSIACLIVGPYRNPDLYQRRRHDWLSRAFALSWVHDEVVLVLPDGAHLESYRRWIKDFTRRARGMRRLPNLGKWAPVVHVVTPFAPKDEAALARLADLK